MAELGLADEADRFPDQLRRTAPASCGGTGLIHRPRLIVADEPTGSLDAESARTVVDLLLAAQQPPAQRWCS